MKLVLCHKTLFLKVLKIFTSSCVPPWYSGRVHASQARGFEFNPRRRFYIYFCGRKVSLENL